VSSPTRRVLVTGGGTGIGFAIARRLARAGDHVVLASRDQGRLDAARRVLLQEGGSCSAHACDIRDPDAVARLFESAGELDVLVNNAAGNFVVPSLELSPNGFRAVIESSLHGSFFCSQELARGLIERDVGGVILNIVATYASSGAPGVVHSAAAKAGLVAITKTLAREWAPYGIRVNALAPGFVATESARSNLLSDPEAEERMRSLIALGRFAEGDEIAAAAAWLVSDEASYCTGSVLVVDGGRSLGPAMHGADERTRRDRSARPAQ
jgi:NAD(P)-dependent dehydrogenase (short-subunit alcohol dehydrogenase family)